MQDKNCIFCQITTKNIPAEIIKETDTLLIFKDKNPSAPTHWLIVPKEHINDLTGLSNDLLIQIKDVALLLAKEHSFNGFRLSNNFGEAAMIPHLHFHFLAGIDKTRQI